MIRKMVNCKEKKIIKNKITLAVKKTSEKTYDYLAVCCYCSQQNLEFKGSKITSFSRRLLDDCRCYCGQQR